MKLLNFFTAVPFLIVLLLSVSACNKDEQILPVLPPTDSTAPDAVDSSATEPVAKISKPAPPAVDSAEYLYGNFDRMPFRILVPKNYDPSRSYPLLIFLHGVTERGSDNTQQLKWGSPLFQTDSIRARYPAFIVFPQCGTADYWFDDTETEMLKGLIGFIQKKYAISKDKISIGGLSMGAYGTYAMAAKYPGLFASAVAIAGDGDETKAAAMAKTKWRIFAGKKDNVVSSQKSEKMAKALKKSGASVLFTLYPDADHAASWEKAFSEPDFCSWIFS